MGMALMSQAIDDLILLLRSPRAAAESGQWNYRQAVRYYWLAIVLNAIFTVLALLLSPDLYRAASETGEGALSKAFLVSIAVAGFGIVMALLMAAIGWALFYLAPLLPHVGLITVGGRGDPSTARTVYGYLSLTSPIYNVMGALSNVQAIGTLVGLVTLAFACYHVYLASAAYGAAYGVSNGKGFLGAVILPAVMAFGILALLVLTVSAVL